MVSLFAGIWYWTGPFTTSMLKKDVLEGDGPSAQVAVEALVGHLQGGSLAVYRELGEQLKGKTDRQEMLGAGVGLAGRQRFPGASELARDWMQSTEVGLKRAGALATGYFPASGVTQDLLRLLENR